MVEISFGEKILKPPVRLPILHGYGEEIDARVLTYSLEEIVAEKLRAVLQHLRLLEQRGWIRSRARDFYDLWRILGTRRERMDLSGFPTFLREKCAVRDVSFNGPDDFFPAVILAIVEKTWEEWLGRLLPSLPPFADVLRELRTMVASLFVSDRK